VQHDERQALKWQASRNSSTRLWHVQQHCRTASPVPAGNFPKSFDTGWTSFSRFKVAYWSSHAAPQYLSSVQLPIVAVSPAFSDVCLPSPSSFNDPWPDSAISPFTRSGALESVCCSWDFRGSIHGSEKLARRIL